MHISILTLLGAATLALASDVEDLKTDTFKSFVAENDLVLAECSSRQLFKTYPCHLLY